MANLTSGERIVRCFLGEDIDRVPFGYGIGWFTWAQTMERWRAESANPNLHHPSFLGYDCSFALPAVVLGHYPAFEYQVLEEDGRYIPPFDHLIPPDVPWEDFVYAAENIKKICYGEG